jgi:hypothetical protein
MANVEKELKNIMNSKIIAEAVKKATHVECNTTVVSARQIEKLDLSEARELVDNAIYLLAKTTHEGRNQLSYAFRKEVFEFIQRMNSIVSCYKGTEWNNFWYLVKTYDSNTQLPTFQKGFFYDTHKIA